MIFYNYKILLYSVLFTLILINCYTGSRGGVARSEYYSPRKMEKFENTYIKFKYSESENSQNQNSYKYYSLYAHYRDWKMFMGFPSSFHPEMDYWRKYYVKFDRIPEGIKNVRFDFIEGCEYRIPTVSGKTEYGFSFIDLKTWKQGIFDKEIDLPAGHTIRLEIVDLRKLTEEEIDAIPEVAGYRPGYRKPNIGYHIIATIEPSGENESIQPCEPIRSQD